MKIEMQKLAEGDEGEWSKAFPVLNADVRQVLEWKLGISKNDSEDIAGSHRQSNRPFPLGFGGENFHRFAILYHMCGKGKRN